MLNPTPTEPERRFISLRSLAVQLDADRNSVRRWLKQAGIAALVCGNGRNAALRYDAAEVEAWMRERKTVA
jgi:hypothetical protein